VLIVAEAAVALVTVQNYTGQDASPSRAAMYDLLCYSQFNNPVLSKTRRIGH